MEITVSNSIPPALAECDVEDSEGTTTSIGSLAAEQATLLVFVRHFGCIGCSENMGLLAPRFTELSDLGVRVVVVGCGPTLFIDGFKERHNLLFSPAEVYTDPSLASHRAAGLMYGLSGGFKPKALIEMGRAFINGHVSSGNQGDIKQQAGAVFIDQNGLVQLYHRNDSLGDHVSGQAIVDAALASWLQQNPEVV